MTTWEDGLGAVDLPDLPLRVLQKESEKSSQCEGESCPLGGRQCTNTSGWEWNQAFTHGDYEPPARETS